MIERTIKAQFQALPKERQARLLDELWLSYQRAEEAREFAPAELAELDRRIAAFDEDPSTGVDADELFQSARATLREA